MPRQTFDLDMMAIALRLAERGLGQTAPNPAVGAVIADETTGEVIARGWTQPGGRPHAETEAIRRAGDRARGATMYVTLEPCAHHGKTPPCAEAIVAAGLKRVVIGIGDPDPRTAGAGIGRLQAGGISVTTGVREAEARRVGLGHILRITRQRPFVQVKLALDAEGAVSRGTGGRPVWVTGPEARAAGHLLRARADAILVGISTVLDDDPQLTCRLPGLRHRSPDRVVLDSRLRTPLGARLLPGKEAHERVWIASTADDETARASPLRAAGADILAGLGAGEGRAGEVGLARLLAILCEAGMTRLLVEGGPSVWRAFAAAGLIDEAILFQARDRQSGAPSASVSQILSRWLPGAALALADERRIGDDLMRVFRPA